MDEAEVYRQQLHDERVAIRNERDFLRDLARRMADALWTVGHGKTPDEDPIKLNQEYYNRPFRAT